jgi:hypothetical protein
MGTEFRPQPRLRLMLVALEMRPHACEDSIMATFFLDFEDLIPCPGVFDAVPPHVFMSDRASCELVGHCPTPLAVHIVCRKVDLHSSIDVVMVYGPVPA